MTAVDERFVIEIEQARQSPRRRGPLANSYVAAVGLVIFALVPYLGLTSALTPLQPVLIKSLHFSKQSFQLTTGMANAGYAFGTVVSIQFASHLRQRRMLLVYVTVFVLASVLTAMARTEAMFVIGHVLQGFTTSLMLIAAVPPLVTGWPAARMPLTGAVMNMCIFGAVAAGPVVGGFQAAAPGNWRLLFWIVAGCGGLAWLLSVLTFEDTDPLDRSNPWDWTALLLAGIGAGAAFFGASELATRPFGSLLVLGPLLGGLGALFLLVTNQFFARHPLMPMRQLLSRAKPVAGIVLAMSAGAASVGTVGLVTAVVQTRLTPASSAALFWPELGGAVVSAVLFASIFRSRLMPLLPIAGGVLLAGGIAVVTGIVHGSDALATVGSGLIGLGVGAAVSPALFVAGFSLRSTQLPQVFAMIELLRAVAAFMVAPVLVHLVATVHGGPTQGGTKVGLWVCFGIAGGGTMLAALILAVRGGLQRPDLERWNAGDGPAWDSPRLFDLPRED